MRLRDLFIDPKSTLLKTLGCITPNATTTRLRPIWRSMISFIPQVAGLTPRNLTYP